MEMSLKMRKDYWYKINILLNNYKLLIKVFYNKVSEVSHLKLIAEQLYWSVIMHSYQFLIFNSVSWEDNK